MEDTFYRDYQNSNLDFVLILQFRRANAITGYRFTLIYNKLSIDNIL